MNKTLFQILQPIRIFRISLTIFVLWVVWQEAHWSVALSLTLISISIESLAASINIIGRALKALKQNNEHTRS